MKIPFSSLHATVAALAALVFFAGCATDTRRSTTEYFQDRALSHEVETALEQEDQIRGLDLNATTVDGVVELSGSVDTPEQRYRAEEIVEGVPGVASVVNNISVGSEAMFYGGRDAEEAEEVERESSARERVRDAEERRREAEVDPGPGAILPDMDEQDPESAGSPTRD